jgi:hypothetical protein
MTVEAVTAGESAESLVDLLGPRAGAAHAAAELGVVEFAGPRLADGGFDAGGSCWLAARQPVGENSVDGRSIGSSGKFARSLRVMPPRHSGVRLNQNV